MFRFTEPSSGQFLQQSKGTYSKCEHYGISYCLQIIFVARIGLMMAQWTETCCQVYNIDNKLLYHCKHNGMAPIKTDYVCWIARGIVLFSFINWPQKMNFWVDLLCMVRHGALNITGNKTTICNVRYQCYHVQKGTRVAIPSRNFFFKRIFHLSFLDKIEKWTSLITCKYREG